MQPVKRLPSGADTRALRQALWHHRIGHRITDSADGALLWIADPRQLSELKMVVERWERGEPLDAPVTSPGAAKSPRQGWALLARVPVTAAVIALCCIIFALIELLGDPLIIALTIVPIDISAQSISYGNLGETLASGQIWRLLSPALLHFGLMHLVFNLMWTWYFGRQIEQLCGTRTLLTLLVAAALVSNLAQYMAGTVLFGGMSGVVYAFLGYVWLMARRAPHCGLFVPNMLVVFMLGWMVFTMTPMAGSVGFGNVANEAHLGGLIVGLASGWYTSSKRRKR